MARFIGTVRGSKGEATRLGAPPVGLYVKAAGWHGYVEVRLFVDNITGKDWAQVHMVDRNGDGRTIYRGPIEEFRDPRGRAIPLYTQEQINEHE